MDQNEIDPEEDKAEFEAHRHRFYEQIGRSVTQYQAVEDFLPTIFAAALGGGRAKALALFELARGLEAKLDAVTTALTEAPPEHQARWRSLLKRVVEAAKARNEIAHASPAHQAGEITIIMGKDMVPSRVFQTSKPQMELRKKTKRGEIVWTEVLMREECERAYVLSLHLSGFSKELRAEPVPEHLKEA